jgi:type II secretory pathway component GspD/PulD (secretin)
MMAMNLTNLIEQTIDPEGWYDNYPDTALGSITLYPQTTPKKMAVMQTAEVHNQIAKLLVELRRALGTQVSIEARFLTVGENFMQDIGLDLDFTNNFGGKWGVVSFQQDSASNSGPESTKVPGTLGGITPAMSITGAYGTVLDDLQVTYLLHMTQARTDARTLTAPRATVISGEPVTFSVSDTIYYTTPGSLTSVLVPGLTAGSTTTPTIPPPGSYSIGPMLMLTPTVMADKKNVLLNMQQATLTEFLGMQTLVQPTVTGTTTGTGTTGTTGGAVQNVVYQMPQIETTSLTTRVSVPDGGTLLLGGQRIAAESKKEVGVPILSKIPIIGKLFSNTSTVKDTRVLLILVKPTIILQEEREAEALGSVEGNNSSTATTQK